MDKIPITNIGFEKLEEELKMLKSIERPAIIKSIAEAREHGDLSENAEYHAAKEKQSFIEGRIADLENKISRAEVIITKKLKSNKVIFGATVTLGEIGKKKNNLRHQLRLAYSHYTRDQKKTNLCLKTIFLPLGELKAIAKIIACDNNRI